MLSIGSISRRASLHRTCLVSLSTTSPPIECQTRYRASRVALLSTTTPASLVRPRTVLAWGRAIECQTGSPPAAGGASHHGAFTPAKLKHIDAAFVAAGANASCVIALDGQTFLFGSGRALGLGAGAECVPEPRALSVQLSSIALSDSTAVAIDRAGAQALVWGVGTDGQLGLGGAMGPVGSYHGGAQEALVVSPRPLRGEPLAGAAAARHRTLLLTQDGVVYAAGSGFHGELGVSGNSGVATAPASVVGLPENDPVSSIVAGHTFTLAATKNGRLFFWGRVGTGGMVGEGGGQTPQNMLRAVVPTELTLPGRPDSKATPTLTLAAGLHHALVSDGKRLWAIGASWEHGGFDSVAVRLVVLPRGVDSIVHIAAGPRTAGIVDGDGRAWLAGRLDSPLLLGAECGASVARALSTEGRQLNQNSLHEGGGCARVEDGTSHGSRT